MNVATKHFATGFSVDKIYELDLQNIEKMKNKVVKKETKKSSNDLGNSIKSNTDVLVYMPERSKQNY